MGWELGLARAMGAVAFSIVIGLLMAFIFRKESASGDDGGMFEDKEGKPIGHLLAFFGTLVAILLFGTAAIPFWSKIAIIKPALNEIPTLRLAYFLM